MEENFAQMLQQYVQQGQSQVLELLSNPDEQGSANIPENVTQAIQQGASGVQELIQQGQQQVIADLGQDTEGSSGSQESSGSNPISSFGVGNTGNDTLTGSGQSNTGISGVNFNFVPAAEGSGNLGQVQLTFGEGEPTTLFTLGSSGPINSSSSGDQQAQGGIGGAANPFPSSDQQGGIGGMNSFGGQQGGIGGATM